MKPSVLAVAGLGKKRGGGGATPVQVIGTTKGILGTNTNPITLTFDGTAEPGDLIVVSARGSVSTFTGLGITSNTLVYPTDGGRLLTAVVQSAGTQITLNYLYRNNARAWIVRGADPDSLVFDGAAGNTGPTLTPVEGGLVGVYAFAAGNALSLGFSTYGPATGWTALPLITDSRSSGVAAHRVANAGGVGHSVGTASAVGQQIWTLDPAGGGATGGTVTEAGGYTIHTFTESGDFVVSGDLTVDVLIAAGGGGGGGNASERCGGGGAGGLKYLTGQAVAAGTFPVVVGAGGATNVNGSASSALGESTVGGGKGGTSGAGTAGGSGGGAGWYNGSPGAGTSGQGSAGGAGGSSGGGGGGGKGSVGRAGGYAGRNGGNGGDGTYYDITGTSLPYAGGGGGAGATTYGIGGSGIGGNGNGANAGAANTGSGGGGGYNGNGGSGGSGVVIIRYLT